MSHMKGFANISIYSCRMSEIRQRQRATKEGVGVCLNTGQSIPVEKVIVVGRRHEEIIRYAIENRVLILMGSHRVDRDLPAGNFGSLSYGVAVLSPLITAPLRAA